jgi:hypothetical protein
MRDERGPWYLLTGLVIGIICGLVYAWRISPVKYVDTSPATLRQDFKDQYRALIGAAYAADNDLARAQARLNLIKDTDSAQAVAIQAQQALASGHSSAEAHALGLLAVALSQKASPSFIPDANPFTEQAPTILTATETEPTTPITATPTLTISTATPFLSPVISSTLPASTTVITIQPALTSTSTNGASFALSGEAKLVCDSILKRPLIMVDAKNSAGQPISGVELIVDWAGGEDHFFTGLKPEHGPGYGDYVMTPDVTYTVHIADGGQPVSGLKTSQCAGSGGSQFLGSWSLVFVQP